MSISKFCEKKYNIFTTKYIQIGSLEYYRAHANDFIRDIQEGVHADVYQSPDGKPQTYDLEQSKSIDERIQFLDPVTIINRLTIGKNIPNCLVFCTSQISPPTVGAGKRWSSDYDSFYSITDPQGFTNEVSRVLQRKLGDLQNATVYGICGPVKYVAEKVNISIGYNKEFVENSKAFNPQWLLVKPKCSSENSEISYELDEEYRFGWFLVDEKNNVLDFCKTVFLVDAKILRRFCSMR